MSNSSSTTSDRPTNFAIFDRLDRDRLVSDLCQMIEIPSVNPFDDDSRPGFREQEMAEFYLDRMSDLGQHGPWADYGIIGEPSDMLICPAHKGQLGFRIQTLGKAVHSSRPEKGINAIEAMAKVIEAFRGYGAELMTRNAHRQGSASAV